jgi:hypothetical protein
MVKIFLICKDFALEYSKYELDSLKQPYDYIFDGLFVIEFLNFNLMIKFLIEFYSKTSSFSGAFLHIGECGVDSINKCKLDISFIKKKYSFNVKLFPNDNLNNFIDKDKCKNIILGLSKLLSFDLDNFDLSFNILSINKKYIFTVDLIGFDLYDRDNIINLSNNNISSLMINYIKTQIKIIQIK